MKNSKYLALMNVLPVFKYEVIWFIQKKVMNKIVFTNLTLKRWEKLTDLPQSPCKI